MNKPVALVTGGSRGIGLGICRELAKQNFDLIVCGRRPQEDVEDCLNGLNQIGADVLYLQLDVSDTDAHQEALDQIRKRFGRLNVLVNNAGVAPKVRADLLDATPDSYDWVMNINLRGPYFLTQAVANWMLEQKSTDPDSSYTIINVSSISAETASPSRGEYCVSKAGISMMTKLYAARLATDGIRVFEVRPGIVKTDMTKVVTEKYDKLIADGLTPIREWIMPNDVGIAVATCATGRIPMSTGQVINVDAGFHLSVL